MHLLIRRAATERLRQLSATTASSLRWCLGIVLWQLFNNLSIPLVHISDEQLDGQLKMVGSNNNQSYEYDI